LTQNIAGAAPSGEGGVSNVTYVYISSPPHTPSEFGAGAAGGPPGGLYLNSAGGPPGGFAPASAYGNGGYAMQPSGSFNSSSGGASFDPRSGSTSGRQEDPLSYKVAGVNVHVRRPRKLRS